MKVVSLFDGISCGRVALERAGFKVERYVAFEIDQDAINCSTWNYPDIEQMGTVAGADFTPYIGFDLVMGGFPCQDLSVANKNRKGLAGQRSGLFWEQVRAIQTIKPKYFLVENNYGMSKADQQIITEALGVEPIYINSALLSAQTRKRLYWTNIPNVEAPEDHFILLGDILEGVVTDKENFHGAAVRGRYNDDGTTTQRLELNFTGKSNALTTVKKDTVLVHALDKYKVNKTPSRDIMWYGGKCPNITHADKSRCLTTKQDRWGNAGLIEHGDYCRYLTPVECERLQTLPDGYTEMLSDTARYFALGNGWTVDVIAHILNHIHIHELC